MSHTWSLHRSLEVDTNPKAPLSSPSATRQHRHTYAKPVRNPSFNPVSFPIWVRCCFPSICVYDNEVSWIANPRIMAIEEREAEANKLLLDSISYCCLYRNTMDVRLMVNGRRREEKIARHISAFEIIAFPFLFHLTRRTPRHTRHSYLFKCLLKLGPGLGPRPKRVAYLHPIVPQHIGPAPPWYPPNCCSIIKLILVFSWLIIILDLELG